MPMEDRLACREDDREQGRRARPTLARCCPSTRSPATSATASSSSRASPARRPAPRPGSGRTRSSTPSSRRPSARCSPPSEQERVSNREFLVVRRRHRGASSRRRRSTTTARCARPKELSINKIGHAMHDLDPVFERFSYTPELAAVAADLGLADALALQSMYIFKQPQHRRRGRLPPGRHVPVHRPDDGHRLLVRDRGRHARERLPVGRSRAATARPLRQAVQARRRRPTTTARCSSELDATPLPTPPDDLVPLEVPAGTLVVLHGLLPHWSDVNRSPIEPPRLLAALHRRRRRLPGVELAAAARRHATALDWPTSPASRPHEHPTPTVRRRCCCTTTSTAACARRPSSSWPTSTATTTCRPPTSTSWRPGSTAAPSATTSCCTSRRSPTRSA